VASAQETNSKPQSRQALKAFYRVLAQKGSLMHNLVRSLPLRTLLLQETPSLVASLLIAETFYKFHSFTLECLAFLGTWWLLSGAMAFVARLSRGHDATADRTTSAP
jgi:hypothetical protein